MKSSRLFRIALVAAACSFVAFALVVVVDQVHLRRTQELASQAIVAPESPAPVRSSGEIPAATAPGESSPSTESRLTPESITPEPSRPPRGEPYVPVDPR
ncbi:MAG: hypothetical protein HYY13_09460 [Nitrospirae bacterium]|nr:hypothetical protein [Nitrospirota bacterium]